jgi:hypothetical protein
MSETDGKQPESPGDGRLGAHHKGQSEMRDACARRQIAV